MNISLLCNTLTIACLTITVMLEMRCMNQMKQELTHLEGMIASFFEKLNQVEDRVIRLIEIEEGRWIFGEEEADDGNCDEA